MSSDNMGSEQEVPARLIAEGLILALEVVSVLAALFIVYIIYLIRSRDRKRAWPSFDFFALVGVFLVLAHYLARASGLLPASAVLLGGMVVCAVFYFLRVRHLWEDDRIRYAMLLWATYWLLTGLLILILWHASDSVRFLISRVTPESFAQYVSTFAQMAGIIIAATMVIVTNRHNAKEAEKTARQGIYQTLELESIQLFRFECQHPDVVEPLWISTFDEVSKRKLSKENTPEVRAALEVQDYQISQHICQILNLFEMSCRFRKQRIMDPEVFGSWMIWMWELCCRPEFQKRWTGKQRIEFNYVAELRDIMNAGIHFATRGRPDLNFEDRRRAFFKYVAIIMFVGADSEWCAHAEKWPDHNGMATRHDFDRHWTPSRSSPPS